MFQMMLGRKPCYYGTDATTSFLDNNRGTFGTDNRAYLARLTSRFGYVVVKFLPAPRRHKSLPLKLCLHIPVMRPTKTRKKLHYAAPTSLQVIRIQSQDDIRHCDSTHSQLKHINVRDSCISTFVTRACQRS